MIRFFGLICLSTILFYALLLLIINLTVNSYQSNVDGHT
jgi:hypothetical protein